MEPTTQQSIAIANEVVVKESPLAPLFRVTTLSKTVAALVFITLPFLGFWLGYEYASKSMVLVPEVYTVETSEIASSTAQLAYDYPKLYTDPKSTSTVRFISKRGSDMETYEEFTETVYLDKESEEASLNSSFLFAASLPDHSIILTKLPTYATDGFDSGLYKYSPTNRTLSTMNVSKYYIPAVSNAVFNSDFTNILVVSEKEKDKYRSQGAGLGVIDLVHDTYTSVGSFDIFSKKRFSLCEFGCYSELKWISDSKVSAKVYEFEECPLPEAGGDVMCGSTVIYDGIPIYSTAAIATSTLEFDI